MFSIMRDTLCLERNNDPEQFHSLMVALLKAADQRRPIKGREPVAFPAYGVGKFDNAALRIAFEGSYWVEEHSQLLFAHS